jgi:hypothetical protein
MILDYQYKYLTTRWVYDCNIVVKPRLRKNFILKWYFIIQVITGAKTVIRLKTFRYRFDNASLRYLLIYVPLNSIQSVDNMLCFIFLPFRVKKINKRLFLRFFIDRYHMSISFNDSAFSKELINQWIQSRICGESSPYLKKHF